MGRTNVRSPGSKLPLTDQTVSSSTPQQQMHMSRDMQAFAQLPPWFTLCYRHACCEAKPPDNQPARQPDNQPDSHAARSIGCEAKPQGRQV
jgi:hypothetical protein